MANHAAKNMSFMSIGRLWCHFERKRSIVTLLVAVVPGGSSAHSSFSALQAIVPGGTASVPSGPAVSTEVQTFLAGTKSAVCGLRTVPGSFKSDHATRLYESDSPPTGFQEPCATWNTPMSRSVPPPASCALIGVNLFTIPKPWAFTTPVIPSLTAYSTFSAARKMRTDSLTPSSVARFTRDARSSRELYPIL